MQTKLKRRRTMKKVLEVASYVSAVIKKEKSVVGEFKPDASPTLSKERSTKMKKLLEVMVSV